MASGVCDVLLVDICIISSPSDVSSNSITSADGSEDWVLSFPCVCRFFAGALAGKKLRMSPACLRFHHIIVHEALVYGPRCWMLSPISFLGFLTGRSTLLRFCFGAF